MRQPPRLPHPTAVMMAVVIVALVMVATAACGETATTPISQSPPAVLPVTITRTGGIAGFRDVLVVASGGLVSITRKGQTTRRCQLKPAAVELLRTAASQVPWSKITPARSSPSFPDDMVTTARSPAGGPVRLEDLRAGPAGRVFRELLDDLSGRPDASRMCTPL